MSNLDPKFQQTYKLLVETQPRAPGGAAKDSNFATIEPPYTVEFSVVRNLMASANTGTFRIYNLNERSRDRVYKDQYNLLEYRAIQFFAGYGDTPPMLFNGNVRQAWSYRSSGSTEDITEIEAYEGAYAMANGFSSQTLGGQSSYASILSTLSKDLPFLDSPKIGNVEGAAKRGTVLWGNTWKLLQKYSGGAAAIDLNRLLILGPNECIEGDIPVIEASSGLLGSPYRSNAMVEFEMVFTPQLKVGQIVKLNSSVNKLFNGLYKVMGFTHTGMISPSVGGSARTTVQLWLGTQALTVI